VPGATRGEIPQSEQGWMVAELRRARYGDLLAWHVLLLGAAGRTPTEIATVLFCSRSSVYRIVSAYTAQPLDTLVAHPPPKTVWLSASICRSLMALLKKAPSAYRWCRTRWSCAALAGQLKLHRGLVVSASTLRRWLHRLGWAWKRAQLVARDDDLQRIEKLARIRHPWETLGKRAILLVADELDLPLLPKVGSQGMPQGATVKLVTPGQNQKHSLAGALELKTGRMVHGAGFRKTNVLFRAFLDGLERRYPKARFDKVSVVVDNYGIHKAQAVERWLAAHPRFELLFLPPYCPQANPIERAFGEVHDKCTRNHQRSCIAELVRDVERHLSTNGPWKYQLSHLYYTPEVTAAVERIAPGQQFQHAA
jgi:transposase